MSDITLAIAPLTERIAARVAPPAESIHTTVTPPAAPPLTLATAAPLPPVRLELTQSIPRILLTVGPQIGVPGAACVPDSRSKPVFTYENGRLTAIAYADGSTKTLTYDPSDRLATLTDTAGGIPRIRTFHYDPDNNLVSIT
jgi:YD repeat-containing protein